MCAEDVLLEEVASEEEVVKPETNQPFSVCSRREDGTFTKMIWTLR